MVLMERIVRPHLPFDSGAAQTQPACQQTPPNSVATFQAPSMSLALANPSTAGQWGAPPEKSHNSSWSYAYKKYMTKKETEQDKCKPPVGSSGPGPASTGRIVGAIDG